MEFPALRGLSILVVEDEMLIGMDIRNALEKAGAHVTATTTMRHRRRAGRDRRGATMAATAKKIPEMPKGSRVLIFNYDTGERYFSIEGLF